MTTRGGIYGEHFGDGTPTDDVFIHITPKCDHDWTGPEVTLERGSSVSCAKCGKLAIDDVW